MGLVYSALAGRAYYRHGHGLSDKMADENNLNFQHLGSDTEDVGHLAQLHVRLLQLGNIVHYTLRAFGQLETITVRSYLVIPTAV